MTYLGIILASVCVLYILYRIFTVEEIEYTEEFHESVADWRSQYIEGVLNTMMCEFRIASTGEVAVTTPNHRDEDTICLEANFARYNAFFAFDFTHSKYSVELQYRDSDGKITTRQKWFKVRKDIGVDRQAIHKFCLKFQNTIYTLVDLPLNQLMAEVNELASDSELAELGDQIKNTILYGAALDLTYALESRRCRRNKHIVQTYVKLMTHIIASGQRQQFIEFIKNLDGEVAEPQAEQPINEEV